MQEPRPLGTSERGLGYLIAAVLATVYALAWPDSGVWVVAILLAAFYVGETGLVQWRSRRPPSRNTPERRLLGTSETGLGYLVATVLLTAYALAAPQGGVWASALVFAALYVGETARVRIGKGRGHS